MHNLDMGRHRDDEDVAPYGPDNLEHKTAAPADHFHALLDAEAFSLEPAHQLLLKAPAAKAKAKKNSWRQARAKYVLIPFTVIVLVLGLVIGSRIAWFAGSVSSADNTSPQAIGNAVGSALGSSIPGLQGLDQSGVATAIRGNRRINILLLGYGGDGHSGAYLTDSMIVLSLDFATNKVTLISVPRDLWVEIPTNGTEGSHWKINAAYELGLDQKTYPDKLPQFTGPNGGGNEAEYVVSEVIGQPIDYYAAMDFDAFRQVVDAVGGVTIDVPDTFTDYSYPNGDQNTDSDNCDATVPSPADQAGCRYLTVHFDKGPQQMDGETALEYARSRHAAGPEGSDFARSRRQQQIIAAVEQKALQLNMLPQLFGVMNALQGHIQTDMSLADLNDFANYMSKVDIADATTGQLTDAGNTLLTSGYSSDGQWILTPTAGQDDYDQIHTYVYDLLNGITTTPQK